MVQVQERRTTRSNDGVDRHRSQRRIFGGRVSVPASSHLFQRADFIADRISRYLSPKREVLLPHMSLAVFRPVFVLPQSRSRAVRHLGKHYNDYTIRQAGFIALLSIPEAFPRSWEKLRTRASKQMLATFPACFSLELIFLSLKIMNNSLHFSHNFLVNLFYYGKISIKIFFKCYISVQGNVLK